MEKGSTRLGMLWLVLTTAGAGCAPPLPTLPPPASPTPVRPPPFTPAVVFFPPSPTWTVSMPGVCRHPFWPLSPGHRWTWRLGASASETMTLEIQDVHGDQAFGALEGVVRGPARFRCLPTGLYANWIPGWPSPDDRERGPWLLPAEDLSPGRRWLLQEAGARMGAAAWAGEEILQVPAGAFLTRRLEIRWERGPLRAATLWFAGGVGPVRWRAEGPEGAHEGWLQTYTVRR